MSGAPGDTWLTCWLAGAVVGWRAGEFPRHATQRRASASGAVVLLQTAGNTACCVRSAACPIRPLSFVTRCLSLPPTLRHGARRHTPYGIDCWACGAARESDECGARGRYAAVVAVKLPSSLGELKKLYRHVPSSLSLYLSRALLLSHSLSLCSSRLCRLWIWCTAVLGPTRCVVSLSRGLVVVPALLRAQA